MKKLLVLLLIISTIANAQQKGTIKTDTIDAKALVGNLTHENTKRAVTIYLPPGYSSSGKHYPVLYLLHGIGDDNMDFAADDQKDHTIGYLMDTAIALHLIKPMIIVTPDEKTNWYGSFYTNSAATGNWEDFTTKELVRYIDQQYHTIPKAGSRAIAGHSMGGYGAIKLAMKHPDIFSSAYGMNSGFIGFVGECNPDDPQMKEFVQAKTPEDYGKLFAQQQYVAVAALTVAQAFSPDTNSPPLYISKPFKIENGKLVPNSRAYQQWQQNDVVNMAAKYKSNLDKLKGIQFDSGYDDQYKFIPINSRLFDKKLSALHIPHRFEEYDGDHRNKLWGLNGRIYNNLLPFVSARLEN